MEIEESESRELMKVESTKKGNLQSGQDTETQFISISNPTIHHITGTLQSKNNLYIVPI